jgi:hypothetical protein
MGKKSLYTRRLSLDESREGYVLITKNALSMFPPPGKSFSAAINGKEARISLESVFCTCRGPEKPHEHYHLPLGEAASRARRGSVARVQKAQGGFRIEVG